MEVGGAHDAALGPTFATAAFDRITPWWDDEGDLRGIAARATGRGAYRLAKY